MHSVVSLLGDEHYQEVENIWAMLESRFIRQGFCRTPYPHLSYHVAESYDEAKLAVTLGELASEVPAFRIRTSGIGIFTAGEHPVIFLSVVRTLWLSELQEKLWRGTEGSSTGSMAYYQPEHWVPHITVAEGALAKDHLPEIIGLLAKRDLVWEIEIKSFSLIYDSEVRQGNKLSFDLRREGGGQLLADPD